MKLERLASDFEAVATLAQKNIATLAKKGLAGLRDEFQFFAGWTQNPLTTGAITPSSRPLASVMADQVDPRLPGPIVELGPGTGVITRALIDRGVRENRLILIEANVEFAGLLRQRFPRARIIAGDAYDLPGLMSRIGDEAPAAIVSGLPLFNRPLHKRISLLNAALGMLDPQGAFVQFSYHIMPPVAPEHGTFRMYGTRRVWMNIFPARVWVYRKQLH